MVKLLYSAGMSLDGFIAGPGGDMSWLTPYMGPDPALDGLAERIGALLVGRRTWTGDDPNRGTDKEGAFSGTWTGPQVVLTRQKPEGLPAEPGVTYSDDVLEAIELAKAGAGDSEYVSILGAGAARSCWEAGALDEVLVSIAPIMLGDGVRLFDLPGGGHVRLERLSASHGPGGTTLWFRVLPD